MSGGGIFSRRGEHQKHHDLRTASPADYHTDSIFRSFRKCCSIESLTSSILYVGANGSPSSRLPKLKLVQTAKQRTACFLLGVMALTRRSTLSTLIERFSMFLAPINYQLWSCRCYIPVTPTPAHCWKEILPTSRLAIPLGNWQFYGTLSRWVS